MRTTKTAVVLFVLFSVFGYSQAQDIVVNLHRPPNDAVSAENLWWVDLINRDTISYDVYIYAYAEEASQGRVFYAYSDTFHLAPGIKRVRPQGGDVHFRNWWVKREIREAVIRTGAIPEANYEYYVDIYGINLPPIPIGGATGSIVVQRPTPPRLVSPQDEDSIGRGALIFNWLPPGNYCGSVSYKLKIVEVMQGQIAEEALRSNRAWFEKSNIWTLSFRYPVSARRLEPGKRYAWQITANFTAGPFEVPIRPLPSEPRSFIKKPR